MTIHHNDDPKNQWAKATAHSSNTAVLPPQKLIVTNPLIYLFILYGVFIRPDKLKAYRMRLNSTERLHLQRQAARLAVTVVWLPLITIFILVWSTGLIEVSGGSVLFALLFAAFSCIISFQNGTAVSLEKRNNMLLGGLLGGFGLTAVLAYGLNNIEQHGSEAIMLVLIPFVFALIGLSIAMVFKLHTLDTLCGMIAIFIGGCIAMTMIQIMTHIWFPIIIILCAILFVGITEERHDLNNNRQSISHR